MLILYWGEKGIELNSPFVTQVTFSLPIHGSAVVVKIWFLPLVASPLVIGIIFPPRLLDHAWGIGMCLSWLVGKSYFLPLVASPLVVGNIPSLTLFLKGLGHFIVEFHSYHGISISLGMFTNHQEMKETTFKTAVEVGINKTSFMIKNYISI